MLGMKMSFLGHKCLGWLYGPCCTRISLQNGRAVDLASSSFLKGGLRSQKDAFAGLCPSSPIAGHASTGSESARTAGDARPLVVLVHGFLGNRVQFLPLASSLSRQDFDVFNFGYASRSETLQEHAISLVDAVSNRVQSSDTYPVPRKRSGSPKAVHYVTHSFGGVVLRAALRTRMLPLIDTRIVLVAPPIRGCILARTVYEADLGDSWRTLSPYVRYAAETVLGTASGQQLMKHPAKWFVNMQDHGPFPGSALVIAGNVGRRYNPLIPEDNDGVVAVSETVLPFPHFREEESLSHNMLLYAPRVIRKIGAFLGNEKLFAVTLAPQGRLALDASSTGVLTIRYLLDTVICFKLKETIS